MQGFVEKNNFSEPGSFGEGHSNQEDAWRHSCLCSGSSRRSEVAAIVWYSFLQTSIRYSLESVHSFETHLSSGESGCLGINPQDEGKKTCLPSKGHFPDIFRIKMLIRAVHCSCFVKYKMQMAVLLMA